MRRLLYLIFFASGATGLVYEVIWVRITGLVFGNTSFSIATVIGAFMAGLALGSWLLGKLADQFERPLRLYGILEILIGISAFLVPFAFRSIPFRPSLHGGRPLSRIRRRRSSARPIYLCGHLHGSRTHAGPRDDARNQHLWPLT